VVWSLAKITVKMIVFKLFKESVIQNLN